MQDRIIPGVDIAQLAHDLQAAGDRMWPRMKDHDWAGRDVEQISPQSFPEFLD